MGVGSQVSAARRLRKRRARPSSVRSPSKVSSLLAMLLVSINTVNGIEVSILRGLSEPSSDDTNIRLSLAAAGSDEEDNAVCHNSASFLGVGNTQCLHKNFRTAVFLLAVIVAVSIGVDRLIHFIRGVIECPQLRRIVNRIFEEVMIMGFLSMVIFTLNTSGAMRSLALNQLTSSEQLHFYEFFHYIVFLTMIYFILIVLLLLFIGTVVPKLIWEIKKHPDRRESISDIHDYGDLYDPRDPSVHGSMSDREDSGSGRRMRHSFIRGVSSLRLDYSTAGSNVDDYERTLDTPSDDIYTGIQSPRQPASRASHTYRTMAMRARALSGMDLVRGSRAYSLLLQRYQREGWGFHFNLRKQWNLWKSFEVLAYNICQNRSGYIYKNPVEMERLFGVRPPPPPRLWSRDSVDIPDDDDGTTEMTYAKYHVLCMRNLLLHMTNIHPSAFLILLVICLLPSIFPKQDHWIFLGVGGLLLLVNVVIFFKVLKILRGIVDDRLRIITMRDIQKRLAKVLKDSDSRIRGRKKRHCTVSASDATPVSMSVEESSEEESNPADENLQSILQARRKKGPLKFKAAALAVRAVIRMQMSSLCHRQLHHHDDRFWFRSPKLLLRLFQFATIGQAFYLVWLSLVEAHSTMGTNGGGSGFLALMAIFPALALCVITPLTMPSLVLVMSLTGIFVDLNASNGDEEGRHGRVTQEQVKTHMRIMRRSFLRSHYTDGGSIQLPQTTPAISHQYSAELPDPVTDKHDAVASPQNVFLRIYDSPEPSSTNGTRGHTHYNSVERNNGSLSRRSSLGLWLNHNRSVGSTSGSADDGGYGTSRRAFNLAAFQSMDGVGTATNNNAEDQDTAQSPASFSSTSCRTPRPTKMVDMNILGPSMSWSQADVDTDALPDNNANGGNNTQGNDPEQLPSPVSASFKTYCSKYGGYPDM